MKQRVEKRFKQKVASAQRVGCGKSNKRFCFFICLLNDLACLFHHMPSVSKTKNPTNVLKWGVIKTMFLLWRTYFSPEAKFALLAIFAAASIWVSLPTRSAPRWNRWSLFSHMVSVRPSVRKITGPENKIHATSDTMHENHDRLLARAWWVILNSLDLFSF